MSDIKKSIRLDPDLAAKVDQARGDVSWSRWVTRAIEERLERASWKEAAEVEVSAAKPARKPPKAPRGFDHAPTCRCGVCAAG